MVIDNLATAVLSFPPGCPHRLAYQSTEKTSYQPKTLDKAGEIVGWKAPVYFVRVRYYCSSCGAQFIRDVSERAFDPDVPSFDRIVEL